MEPHELHTLLNNKMGEMLAAMNANDMTLAMELREDLVNMLVADREKVAVAKLKEVKKTPKAVDEKIAEAEARAEHLELSVKHPEAKK